MKFTDLTHHFPLAGAIMEVQASTKKKQGYIKVAVPDELLNHLMNAAVDCATDNPPPIDGLIIAYRDKSVTLPKTDDAEEHS